MISIPLADYVYCKSHFIRISDLCGTAIKKYISKLSTALDSLTDEIPPLVLQDQPFEDESL